MPTLVKFAEDGIHTAPNFVHAPGYSLIVKDLTKASVLPDGWEYYEEDIQREFFPEDWNQTQDGYNRGDQVYWGGSFWQSLKPNNTDVPGSGSWEQL